MEKIRIQEVLKTSPVEILGHVFNGLSEIEQAVEAYCRIEGEPWKVVPETVIDGIHVICIYEPYPCFDFEDFGSEDRAYSNYFFSTAPFTNIKIKRFSKLPAKFNAQIVKDTMPEWAAPAVYYNGDGCSMVVGQRRLKRE